MRAATIVPYGCFDLTCRRRRLEQSLSVLSTERPWLSNFESICMFKNERDTAPLNHTPCPSCGKHVDDRAPACPKCGEKIYVEHPADITPTKHPPLPMN